MWTHVQDLLIINDCEQRTHSVQHTKSCRNHMKTWDVLPVVPLLPATPITSRRTEVVIYLRPHLHLHHHLHLLQRLSALWSFVTSNLILTGGFSLCLLLITLLCINAAVLFTCSREFTPEYDRTDCTTSSICHAVIMLRMLTLRRQHVPATFINIS